jgi:hypothetical protein
MLVYALFRLALPINNGGGATVSQDWGSSANGARIEVPRGVAYREGYPLPGGGEAVRPSLKIFIFCNENGGLWWILKCYKLKLHIWFTTSYHRRISSFNACLTQRLSTQHT